ncbi:hypothetical protein TBLA_0D05450 [Henningerozyma blattae CBS 6284]|uniref:Large ribosomal subunit protein bL21m n=1 Tax=Henningerozyma blattae (strain ATCC 34711 / CBS 6284 / DSM 70876 / NBRC 10599 / NRRL Y-10934 / UCD 77-7) TaxID=1071380 RepID=I2H3T6_HENB6|nr:hypothetical protein TBLA_0D05450 [Tetrapisispora blattae CBS 6284]CCH61038.1 hypothetical protein TBLA_0D05450 [Tetrapisispora blattae CBS 6284]
MFHLSRLGLSQLTQNFTSPLLCSTSNSFRQIIPKASFIGLHTQYSTLSEPIDHKDASATSSNILENTIKSTTDLTPLKLSNELYASFRIHNRPYLVTLGDKVILPFKLKQADVGDTLKLTDVTKIGSRNYTFVDNPIDPKLYSLKAIVIEKTKGNFM